jgi:hypothetical protein
VHELRHQEEFWRPVARYLNVYGAEAATDGWYDPDEAHTMNLP